PLPGASTTPAPFRRDAKSHLPTTTPCSRSKHPRGTTRAMPGELEALMADQARWRDMVGSRALAYHRVLEALALHVGDPDRARELEARLAQAWRSRSFAAFYERPLLLLNALRHDALLAGREHPLWAGLAASEPDADAVDAERLARALGSERLWRSLGERFAQANETSRAVAWLWPAWLAGCDSGARPLALVEIGCAAGLNLVGDALPAPWVAADGSPLPVVKRPDTQVRLGLDRHPLDVSDPDSLAWMRACIWPGERARAERFEAAV